MYCQDACRRKDKNRLTATKQAQVIAALVQGNSIRATARMTGVNLRSADLTIFSGEEIAWVDKVIDFWKSATAKSISRYTHRWQGWKAARENETIQYETVFISEEPLTEYGIARGEEMAAQIAKRAAA